MGQVETVVARIPECDKEPRVLFCKSLNVSSDDEDDDKQGVKRLYAECAETFKKYDPRKRPYIVKDEFEPRRRPSRFSLRSRSSFRAPMSVQTVTWLLPQGKSSSYRRASAKSSAPESDASTKTQSSSVTSSKENRTRPEIRKKEKSKIKEENDGLRTSWGTDHALMPKRGILDDKCTIVSKMEITVLPDGKDGSGFGRRLTARSYSFTESRTSGSNLGERKSSFLSEKKKNFGMSTVHIRRRASLVFEKPDSAKLYPNSILKRKGRFSGESGPWGRKKENSVHFSNVTDSEAAVPKASARKEKCPAGVLMKTKRNTIRPYTSYSAAPAVLYEENQLLNLSEADILNLLKSDSVLTGKGDDGKKPLSTKNVTSCKSPHSAGTGKFPESNGNTKERGHTRSSSVPQPSSVFQTFTKEKSATPDNKKVAGHPLKNKTLAQFIEERNRRILRNNYFE